MLQDTWKKKIFYRIWLFFNLSKRCVKDIEFELYKLATCTIDNKLYFPGKDGLEDLYVNGWYKHSKRNFVRVSIVCSVNRFLGRLFQSLNWLIELKGITSSVKKSWQFYLEKLQSTYWCRCTWLVPLIIRENRMFGGNTKV